MRIQVLHIDGCPNTVVAEGRMRSALKALGFGEAPLESVLIRTESEAADAQFGGSPTFLVDGKDLFPASPAHALACRLYATDAGLAGVPSQAQLEEAIGATTEPPIYPPGYNEWNGHHLEGSAMSYGINVTVNLPYDAALAATKEALAAQKFGVLSEIDVAATLKTKLGEDVGPYTILGACMPPMALQAVRAEPSIGLLLPCNVVVRAADEGTSIVEAIDTHTMVTLTGNADMAPVAEQVGRSLQAVLDSLPH